MHRFIFFIFSIFLVSCGVTRTYLTPERFTTFAPELNEINNGEIGNTLVYGEKGHQNDAIEITKTVNIEINGVVKVIEKGNIFTNKFYTDKYEFYSSSLNSEFGIAIEKNIDNIMIYTNSDNDGIYASGISYNGMSLLSPKDKIDYSETKVLAKDKDNFKQEFIYNGRVKEALKFIYREYKNDYARPAFTQEIQYDITENETIGFLGMRIKIINATNTEIEYKVLNYFEK